MICLLPSSDNDDITIDPGIIEQMLLNRDPTLLVVYIATDLTCAKLHIQISDSLIEDITD